MNILATSDYPDVSRAINNLIAGLQFEVNPVKGGLSGKWGVVDKTVRVFRIVPIDKKASPGVKQSLAEVVKIRLPVLLEDFKYSDTTASNIVYNVQSPNSGSFPSVSFNLDGNKIDLVIAGTKKNAALKFESILVEDLNNYFAGGNSFRYGDAVDTLVNHFNLQAIESNRAKKKDGVGRRNVTFTGSEFKIDNNNGPTIGDITVVSGGRTRYISLKIGSQFFILNSAVGKYFRDSRTKKAINEFFGFNGIKMGDFTDTNTKERYGFGSQYSIATEPPDYNVVKQNLAKVLKQGYGKELTVLHRTRAAEAEETELVNGSLNYVKDIGDSVSVSITSLDESSYSYPVIGKRAYANIKVKATIADRKYSVDFQFRSTTGGVREPQYLRLLLKPEK